MNIASPPTHPPARAIHAPQGPQRDMPRRPTLLTDDQYLASSLALVADLSRRVRDAMPEPRSRKFCRTGFKPS